MPSLQCLIPLRVLNIFARSIFISSITSLLSLDNSHALRSAGEALFLSDFFHVTNGVFHVVRRILACLHSPHHGFPPLPSRAVVRQEEVYPKSSHQICPRHGHEALAVRGERPMEHQPDKDLQEHDRSGFLGKRETEQTACRKQTGVDEL